MEQDLADLKECVYFVRKSLFEEYEKAWWWNKSRIWDEALRWERMDSLLNAIIERCVEEKLK